MQVGTDALPYPSGESHEHLMTLWAKWSRSQSTITYHPLLCHLIDVALVTWTMWREVLPPASRRRFAAALNVDEEAAGYWLACFAGLHDLGKASPAFQFQKEEAKVRLCAAGLP